MYFSNGGEDLKTVKIIISYHMPPMMNLTYLKLHWFYLMILQILVSGYIYQNENDVSGLKFTYLWLHQDGSITPYN